MDPGLGLASNAAVLGNGNVAWKVGKLDIVGRSFMFLCTEPMMWAKQFVICETGSIQLLNWIHVASVQRAYVVLFPTLSLRYGAWSTMKRHVQDLGGVASPDPDLSTGGARPSETGKSSQCCYKSSLHQFHSCKALKHSCSQSMCLNNFSDQLGLHTVLKMLKI